MLGNKLINAEDRDFRIKCVGFRVEATVVFSLIEHVKHAPTRRIIKEGENYFDFYVIRHVVLSC